MISQGSRTVESHRASTSRTDQVPRLRLRGPAVLRSFGFGFPNSVKWFRSSGFGQAISVFRIRSSGFGLPDSVFGKRNFPPRTPGPDHLR